MPLSATTGLVIHLSCLQKVWVGGAVGRCGSELHTQHWGLSGCGENGVVLIEKTAIPEGESQDLRRDYL